MDTPQRFSSICNVVIPSHMYTQLSSLEHCTVVHINIKRLTLTTIHTSTPSKQQLGGRICLEFVLILPPSSSSSSRNQIIHEHRKSHRVFRYDATTPMLPLLCSRTDRPCYVALRHKFMQMMGRTMTCIVLTLFCEM